MNRDYLEGYKRQDSGISYLHYKRCHDQVTYEIGMENKYFNNELEYLEFEQRRMYERK